ncbi:LOW QUALITY PROTEIN: nicotinamidase-like, partial [Penaeus monodon]|uniref:LOW QUALITY PROTEIN: nicotinamidase-like n=1 Tax=Penaeus monodon TaxID=6687 RepID=UPI0018A74329
ILVDIQNDFLRLGTLEVPDGNERLSAYLKKQGIDTLYIRGLATDYCVKFTCLDAISEGFETYLIEDGTRGVNLKEGDVEKAFPRKCGKRELLSSSLMT